VARFARQRMSERMPELDSESQTGGFQAPATKTEKPSRPQQPDLLSKFLQARESRPDFMTDTLVQTMAVSMAFAGSETTAISLAAVFYYLLRSPPALARLRAELDDYARRGGFSDYETGLVTWTESQRLPYLDACVKEAFRMHPAAGLPLERIVPEAGSEIVAGVVVPGGTIVGCSAWVIHRRPEIFGEDVDVFRPERWLVDESVADRAAEERRIKEMNGMMFQFGAGSRTCIGKNISLLEIYKVVPSLLRRFEVSHSPLVAPASPAYPRPWVLASLGRAQPGSGGVRLTPRPWKQIQFKDPSQEWELVNAWFIKQNNFQAVFSLRDLVQPDPGVQRQVAGH
jgi:cytochrome P450